MHPLGSDAVPFPLHSPVCSKCSHGRDPRAMAIQSALWDGRSASFLCSCPPNPLGILPHHGPDQETRGSAFSLLGGAREEERVTFQLPEHADTPPLCARL